MTPNGSAYSGEVRSFLLRDYHRRRRKAPEQSHVSGLSKKLSSPRSAGLRSPVTETAEVLEPHDPIDERPLVLSKSGHTPITVGPDTSPTCDSPLGVSGLDPYQTMALKVSRREGIMLLHCRWIPRCCES